MKIKINRIIIYLITFIYLISLISKTDFLAGNISGILSNPKYHLELIIFGILLFICLYKPTYQLCKNKMYLLVLIMIGATITPYNPNNHFIKDIHILLMYISFFGLTIFIYYLIFKFSIYNYIKFKKLFIFYTFILLIVLSLYISFLAINSLIEVIYLTSVLLISIIIENYVC